MASARRFARSSSLIRRGRIRNVGEYRIGQQVQAGPAVSNRKSTNEWIHHDFPSAITDLVNQLLGGEDLNVVEFAQVVDRGGSYLVGPRYTRAFPGAVFGGFGHYETAVAGPGFVGIGV